MLSLIRDLHAHQAWADAEQWRAVAACPAARDDEAVRARLHHIHLVQHTFIWTVGDRAAPFGMTSAADFETFDALRAYARKVHALIDGELARLSDADLAGTVAIPWFEERPLAITRGEALLQAVMHSQWHRGQNATRLRELGAVPPTLDLIVWFWLGRPAAHWEDR